MIGSQARHGQKPVQASRTGLTVQELKAMTAMRMGQGADVVMNGYAMGAQNNPAGMAAAQVATANQRYRPQVSNTPPPLLQQPQQLQPLQQQQQQQQQPQQQPLVIPPRVSMVPAVTVIPNNGGGRVPDKAPVHSLTVQELKELTRMRLAREALGPTASPSVPPPVPGLSSAHNSSTSLNGLNTSISLNGLNTSISLNGLNTSISLNGLNTCMDGGLSLLSSSNNNGSSVASMTGPISNPILLVDQIGEMQQHHHHVPGSSSFRPHGTGGPRHLSGNSLVTLTTVESRDTNSTVGDYLVNQNNNLVSRSSTTSPVSDSAFIDADGSVNANGLGGVGDPQQQQQQQSMPLAGLGLSTTSSQGMGNQVPSQSQGLGAQPPQPMMGRVNSSLQLQLLQQQQQQQSSSSDNNPSHVFGRPNGANTSPSAGQNQAGQMNNNNGGGGGMPNPNSPSSGSQNNLVSILEAQRRDLRASLRGEMTSSSDNLHMLGVTSSLTSSSSSNHLPLPPHGNGVVMDSNNNNNNVSAPGGGAAMAALQGPPMTLEAQATAMARLRLEQRALLQQQQQQEVQQAQLAQQQQQQQQLLAQRQQQQQQQQQQQLMEHQRRLMRQQQDQGQGMVAGGQGQGQGQGQTINGQGNVSSNGFMNNANGGGVVGVPARGGVNEPSSSSSSTPSMGVSFASLSLGDLPEQGLPGNLVSSMVGLPGSKRNNNHNNQNNNSNGARTPSPGFVGHPLQMQQQQQQQQQQQMQLQMHDQSQGMMPAQQQQQQQQQLDGSVMVMNNGQQQQQLNGVGVGGNPGYALNAMQASMAQGQGLVQSYSPHPHLGLNGGVGVVGGQGIHPLNPSPQDMFNHNININQGNNQHQHNAPQLGNMQQQQQLQQQQPTSQQQQQQQQRLSPQHMIMTPDQDAGNNGIGIINNNGNVNNNMGINCSTSPIPGGNNLNHSHHGFYPINGHNHHHQQQLNNSSSNNVSNANSSGSVNNGVGMMDQQQQQQQQQQHQPIANGMPSQLMPSSHRNNAMPCPPRERAVSELQDSNGLAFEMAESVLDLGSSPPSTPQLTHRKLLPPVGMGVMGGMVMGGASENHLAGAVEGGNTGTGAGGSSSSTHPSSGPTDFLTQALNSLSSSDSIGSLVDEGEGGADADRSSSMEHIIITNAKDICPTLLLPAAAVVNGVVGGVMGGNSPLSSSSCSGKDITDGLTLSAGAATN